MSPHGPMIPHSRPTIGPEDVEAVAEVVRSGHLAQGEKVREFEERVAGFLGRRDGVATNCGTSALHLALLALGVGSGDEVLVPSYTCVALLHAVRYVGATPRVVDLEAGSYNLPAHAARRHLTARTRVVIVPHMFGEAADLEPLLETGIPVIEDLAQALGGSSRGRPVGSRGTIAVCSFYATKMMATGEGGMLLSDSELLLRRARDLRDYDGRTAHTTRFNYKMTDLQAALGLTQLAKLASFVARRQALAVRYTAALRHLPVGLPGPTPGSAHAFYRYVIGVEHAPRVARWLCERGVECKAPVSCPLHRCLDLDGFPWTERAMNTALSIPLYPSLTEQDVATVLSVVADGVRREEALPRRALSLRS